MCAVVVEFTPFRQPGAALSHFFRVSQTSPIWNMMRPETSGIPCGLKTRGRCVCGHGNPDHRPWRLREAGAASGYTTWTPIARRDFQSRIMFFASIRELWELQSSIPYSAPTARDWPTQYLEFRSVE